MKPFYTVGYGETRGFTNGIYALIDEGMLSPEAVLEELLCHLSEDEVEEFVDSSLFFRDDDNECVIRYSEEEEEELEEEEEEI